jgi:membrane fusion protein, copper/silver efflux system
MAEHNNPIKTKSPKRQVVAGTAAPLIKSVDRSTPVVVTTNESSIESAKDKIVPLEELPTSNSMAEIESKSVQIVDAAAPVVVETSNKPKRSVARMSLEIFRLFLAPALIVGAFAAGIALLGIAQRNEWIKSVSTADETSAIPTTSEETEVTYICPMMCVPPTTKPGRCPVCAMELVPASKGSSSGPSTTIEIDPRSRRVAGIKTTVATLQTLSREVSSVGEIKYDETQQKTLSAYIDGRIEELTADYTGVEVKKGESLGQLYSPDLYSAQVEYVKTLEFNEKSVSSNARVQSSNERLLKSSRQRLIELGMTEPQIKNLESERVAKRTLDLYAPISGTVIEKMATVGQYIKAGAPIYRLADLSKVWLVIELFPEDAKAIRLGQKVTATTQSLGSDPFEGTVEFIEPTVDPKMRTVGVRVAINNEKGFLKPGEFAQATLTIPLASSEGMPQETVVIPRNSLLSIGKISLAYVEKRPGEFQLRKIKTGPSVDGMVAVLEGIAAGENVVSKSTFLLDAQMQLQGNPSLIDPDKAIVDDEAELTEAEKEEIRKAMEPLSQADRALAESQVICPVTEVRLGSMGMGTPIKLEIEGRTVFICCEGCRDSWVNEPDKYFKILDDYLSGKRKTQNAGAPTPIAPTDDDGELPQMQLPQMKLPKMELPQMELPKMEPPKQ